MKRKKWRSFRSLAISKIAGGCKKSSEDVSTENHLPCSGAQTCSAHGRKPARSGEKQRDRHEKCRRSGRQVRRRYIRPRLHGQSGQPDERDGRNEAHCRNDHPDVERNEQNEIRRCSVRKRLGEPRQRHSAI